NLDGTSGYAEIATILVDTEVYEREVFLPTHINASYLLQACNDNGCVDSNFVSLNDDLSGAIGYIKASNPGAEDLLGIAIAISGDGNTLAVGAVGEDSSATGINGEQADEEAPQSGAVYIFAKDNNVWVQQAYVKASNAETYDWFGSHVALSGDGGTLAVTASGEDGNAVGINGDQTNGHPTEDGDGNYDPSNKCCWSDSTTTNSGAVYIFVRSDETWIQQAYIKASNTDYFDAFGESIALSSDGNTLVVGNSYESSGAVGINGDQSDNSVFGSGAVYVFSRESGVWSQQAYIKASRSEEYMRFGLSVALSSDGNTLSVGAPDDLSNLTDHSSGTVYIFTRSNEVWNQQAFVKASNAEMADWFGGSVALSADGSTLAVGALRESSDSVGINGDQTNNNAEQSGAVYIFVRNGESWGQQAYVKASNAEAFDGFGGIIALSADGNTLAISAYEASSAVGINGDQDSNDAIGGGAVYLFVRDGSIWSQRAYIKASNTEERDGFGSIALSADGNTLAVAAVEEDSNAVGINGDQTDNSVINSGAVYLY
ncbi:MAG: integrin, partial [Gammaproteobacteria bacterium]|nr:integrin [Gammaproteobacteria bacterium]